MSGNDENIGDGGASITLSSSPGSPVYIKSTDISTLPIETIINSGVSNNKNTHAFSDNVKQFMIRSEKVVEIKYSFDEFRFDLGNKLTITSGGILEMKLLDLPSGTEFYFSIVQPNIDVEILEWT